MGYTSSNGIRNDWNIGNGAKSHKLFGGQRMDTIVFCAFRYALGRKTYVVSEVVEEIIKRLPEITEQTKMQMSDEIFRAITSQKAGMDIDVAEWLKLKEAVEENLNAV